MTTNTERRLTGRHVLFAMIAFFGTIVAVNVVMATYATSSWTGLVVKNSYVESQKFNAKLAEADEQAARGWSHSLTLAEDTFILTLKDADGAPIRLSEATAAIGRPAYESEDHTVAFKALGGGRYLARTTLAPGQWQVHVRTTTEQGEDWRLRYRLTVPKGHKS